MAKTNPIGVRFDERLLESVKKADLAKSPQKALNLYEKSYVELVKLKIEQNNKPENKKRILEERENVATDKNVYQYPPDEKEFYEEPKRHPLWKEGDPAEKTMAFYLRYGVFSYDEIEK